MKSQETPARPLTDAPGTPTGSEGGIGPAPVDGVSCPASQPEGRDARTPEPWRAVDTSVWAGDEQIAACDWVLECGHCGVADGPDYRAGQAAFNPREVREANAAFIARACNAHDELLEALVALHNCIDPDSGELRLYPLKSQLKPVDVEGGERAISIWDAVCAAINKAEGGQ